jgi:hypothetical protein
VDETFSNIVRIPSFIERRQSVRNEDIAPVTQHREEEGRRWGESKLLRASIVHTLRGGRKEGKE